MAGTVGVEGDGPLERGLAAADGNRSRARRPAPRVAWPIAHHERGSGEPLLLLAGVGASSRVWPQPWLERLERSFRLVLVDNRGTGGSPYDASAFSMADLAADALGVLDRCGIDSTHVLGQSMGSLIALTLAMECPERVRRLVIGSASAGGDLGVSPAPEVLRKLAELRSSNGAERTDFLEVLSGPSFTTRCPEVATALVDGAGAEPRDQRLVSLQLAAMGTFDRSRLGMVRAPTLVLHGDADAVVPLQNAYLLAAALRDATVAVPAASGT